LEGKILIKEIKSIMNKRINEDNNYLNIEEQEQEINKKVINILKIPSPYVIKDGKRRKRNKN